MKSTSGGGEGTIELREVEPADTDECARIIYEAFGAIHDQHHFARDFPTLEAAGQLAGAFISHPSIWGVVAERDGCIVGSNFLDERGPVRGLGPVTVDPRALGHGLGRRLMEAALERGREAAGIRLFQDSFNVASLALYASLGFEVKEPCAVMERHAEERPGRRRQSPCPRGARSRGLRGPLRQGPRLRADEGARRLSRGSRPLAVRGGSRRAYQRLCHDAYLLPGRLRRRRDGGRHARLDP
ncbi:MAG TPA: GNAT family N-acetyltransferase, partial [Thermoleophilaceae bacterium]|nr:GNAT family N-acetyltransferase [Thermoleophilaceae bacterium]